MGLLLLYSLVWAIGLSLWIRGLQEGFAATQTGAGARRSDSPRMFWLLTTAYGAFFLATWVNILIYAVHLHQRT